MDCKRFTRTVLVLTAVVLVIWGVAGCNNSKSTETTKAAQSTDSSAPPVTAAAKKSTLRIGWSESPQAGMNPFLARTEGDYVYLGLMYEPLAMPMMDGTLKPWLAKSWTYSSTDSSWTFVLDDRAKWSDGQPLTADDVKFTFDTAYKLDLAIGATTKAFVKSVDVVDAHTVSFKMAQPLAAFASLAGGTLIMPKHIWESVPAVDKSENATPVGSGPFVFKEFKARSFLDVTKNPNYWQGPVNVDEVVVQVFSNAEAEVMALKKGELDVMPDLSGSEALIPALISDPNVKVLIDKWPHILYLAPNYRVPALANKDVRKAMDLAIDRQAIVSTALAGYGELPLMGYVPPVVTKWADTSLTWKGLNLSAEQRVKDANAILDAAGFKAGSDGIRVGTDGKKLEFTPSAASPIPPTFAPAS